jgi:hypothetical protein
MSEAKHTPLPWHACCGKCHTIMSTHHPIAQITVGDWGDDYPSIRLVGDSSLALKAEPYMAQITYGHIEKEVAIANAAFIVKAVNAHDDLVKALRECRIAMWADNPADGWKEIIEAADAALAKAEAS